MLNFEIICLFLGRMNLKSSVRVFHSLMDDGKQYFCVIQVRL